MRLELDIQPLNLSQTLGCGQTFRWRQKEDGSWVGPLDGQLVTLRQKGPRLFVEAVPGGRGVRELVETHLRKQDDVEKVRKELGKDPILAPGLDEFSGLRIVKLEEWECLCSFALATYANIPRITKMIETLASRFGGKISGDVHAFPTIERMKKLSLSELSRCGLGYRAKYIHDMSQMLSRHHIDDLTRLRYEELRSKLIELPGVGDKVADCVALFGFGKLEAFPIDVWMKRALERLYGQTGNYGKLRAFAQARFGLCAGYAQEYMYYNERAHAPKGACAFSK
jgi:N-glycosylase/DNA lyase